MLSNDHSIQDLNRLIGNNQINHNNTNGVENGGIHGEINGKESNETQVQVKEFQFQWTNAGAPFAAVFLSAWVIVLSFMGQVMSR